MCSDVPLSDDVVIRVRDISKHFLMYDRPEDRLKQMIIPRIERLVGREPRRYFQDFAALNEISFDIHRGETVGIVGRNGCGKSTLLQIICGILQPSTGSVEVNGRVAALLELGAGFNPEFTGRENVYMNAAILGLSHEETKNRFQSIESFADIGIFIDQPVKTYSSGMYVRLAFATAINVDPDILVIDEALAVGDVAFQRKCFARLEQIQQRGGTILFVSHSTGSVVELCNRAMLIDGGELLLEGKPKQVTNQYLKLVYMPAEKLPEEREKIKQLKGLPDEELVNKNDKDTEENAEQSSTQNAHLNGKATELEPETAEEKAKRLEEEEGWYDPHLKSESVVEYESKGACIRDLRILAPSGRQVNHLRMGVRYTYEYYVDFDVAVTNVCFGMVFKTIKGVELTGANNAKSHHLKFAKVNSGQIIKVTFDFECGLMPGIYFGTAGVMADLRGEGEYLHRLIDQLPFRVIPGSEISDYDFGYFGLNTKFNAVEI